MGRARVTLPRTMGAPSRATPTSSGQDRSRMFSSPANPKGVCWTMNTAAGKSTGSWLSRCGSISTPPKEAPMTVMSWQCAARPRIMLAPGARPHHSQHRSAGHRGSGFAVGMVRCYEVHEAHPLLSGPATPGPRMRVAPATGAGKALEKSSCVFFISPSCRPQVPCF